MVTFINDTLIRLIEVTMTSRYWNNLIDLLITIWRVKPEYLETAINSTVPTETTLGFEPRPKWWEVSALTTAPPLLPELMYY